MISYINFKLTVVNYLQALHDVYEVNRPKKLFFRKHK